jgi:hypothetical protein
MPPQMIGIRLQVHSSELGRAGEAADGLGCGLLFRAGMKQAHEMAGSTHAVVRCKSNQTCCHQAVSTIGTTIGTRSP